MKILVPLDMTQPVKPIVDEVVHLCQTKNAHVRLLFVKEELPSFESVVKLTGDFPDDWEHQAENKARAIFDEASELFKPHCAKVDSEIVSGPAAYMIETVARDEHFDVTCVTPKSHNLAERLFLGRVSSKVVKHGPGTTVIMRPRPHASAAMNVLVGIDGSKNCKAALSKAVKEFNLGDSATRITLTHAVDVADAIKFLTPVEFVASIESNLSLEGETFLADGNRILSESGRHDVNLALHKGDPASVLLKTAKDLQSDFIVLGARGHTAVQHFLLGSVSHRIASHAQASVAVVKV